MNKNLQRKIREKYINNFKAQTILGEFCQGKPLKEVNMMDGLLKYKQFQPLSHCQLNLCLPPMSWG